MSLLGATGAALTWSGCGSNPTSPTTSTAATAAGAATPSTTTTTTGTAGAGSATGAACQVSPTETLGPFPSIAKFVRSDIRESRTGVPLSLTITVLDVNNACAAVANAVVDVWQCDAEGHYSEYSQAGYNGTSETFLRGMQTTDGGGHATFTTVYPGWYAGRATHIHVEVTVNGRSVKVTQIAFPESVTAGVYASGVYASHGQNPTTNARDMVFSDGVASELATVSGSVASGYAAAFTTGIAL